PLRDRCRRHEPLARSCAFLINTSRRGRWWGGPRVPKCGMAVAKAPGMKSPFVKMHYLLVLVVAAAAIAAIAAGGERAPAPVAAEKAGPAAPTAAAGPSEGDLIQGAVLEVINVPSYTYLRVQRGAGQETWAAVPSAAVQVGE